MYCIFYYKDIVLRFDFIDFKMTHNYHNPETLKINGFGNYVICDNLNNLRNRMYSDSRNKKHKSSIIIFYKTSKYIYKNFFINELSITESNFTNQKFTNEISLEISYDYVLKDDFSEIEFRKEKIKKIKKNNR